MAMVWKIRTVSLEDAEVGTGTWEPFTIVEDKEGNPLVVLKGLFEEEGEKSSTKSENFNWAGTETTE